MNNEHTITLPNNKKIELPLGGTLFLGAMGAGKSLSLASQAYKYCIANPHALIFLLEAEPNGTNYAALHASFNYFRHINTKRTIMNAVHFLIKELRERKKLSRGELAGISPALIILEHLHYLSKMFQPGISDTEEGITRLELLELLEDGPGLKMYTLATSTMIEGHSVELARAFRSNAMLRPGNNNWEHIDQESFDRAKKFGTHHKGRGILNGDEIQFEILGTFITDKKEQAKLLKDKNPFLNFIFPDIDNLPSKPFQFATVQFRGQVEDALNCLPPVTFQGFQDKLKKSAVELIRDHLVTSSSTQSTIAKFLSYDKGNFSKLLSGQAESLSMDKVFEVLYLLRPKNNKINRFLVELENVIGEGQ
jgi:hypothetical protein